MGQLSFSASLADRGQGAGANLYDEEEDNFAATAGGQHENKEEHSEPAISPIKPQSMSSNNSAQSYHSQGRLESLAEDDAAEQQADVVVMPASVGAGLFLSQHVEDEDEGDDMTVSLDGDEPIARNVELIVDQGPEEKRPHADIQLEKSRSPVLRSNLISGKTKTTSYQAETLHVSAAPFSLPSHASRTARGGGAASSVNDNYSPLSGGDEESPFQPASSTGQRAQSRLITHPKSSSYREGGGVGFLSGEKANFGGEQQAVGRQRRASMQRRMAAAKAASFNNGTGSSNGSSNMPIPRSSTAPSSSHPSNTSKLLLPPLDPYASPVRSKVKFADSPRDRTAAEQMRKNMKKQEEQKEGQEVALTEDGVPNVVPQPAQPNQLVPRERAFPKPLLKHREPLAPLPSPTPVTSTTPLLVLPIYYRFLILQTLNCAMWTLAGFVLVACGTNLVQWGTNENTNQSNVDPTHPTSPSNPNGDTHSWFFGLVMGLLMAIHSCVLDGLLIFLASKNVGRQSIRFAYTFGLVWGAVNGLAVIAVTQAVPRNNSINPTTGAPSHVSSSLLPLSHPFFTRSCLALLLNLLVLGLPAACFCGTRARRTNTWCVKSKEEKLAALQRQQARWDARQEVLAGQQSIHTISSATASTFGGMGGMESTDLTDDSFDEDDYVTDDSTRARTTWFYFGLINLAFHSMVLLFYVMDFTQSNGSDGEGTSKTWSTLLLVLFVLSFIFSTPLLYYCLKRDSLHWEREWKGVLERMRQEAEAEEAVRKQERAAEELLAKKEGRTLVLPPSRPNPYSSFESGGKMSQFFLDYSMLEYGPMLGSGGFSSVYSARLGRFDVAVKVLHVRDPHEGGDRAILT